MRIFFDNVNFNSNSGPNAFGYKLAREFVKRGHIVTSENPDFQFSFIQKINSLAPTALRLDGIYFNSKQNWESMNIPLKQSYDNSEFIVVQSRFDKQLIETYFGARDNVNVIHNGTDLESINNLQPANIPGLSSGDVWMCAAAWRPHKRLKENIRFFTENAGLSDILLVAGKDADQDLINSDDRIFYLGEIKWQHLVSGMKLAKYFIHLAWLDHCPNVVIDARAAGCHIICSSAGGTVEIAGDNCTIVQEKDWDYSPVELYNPPEMNFNNTSKQSLTISDISISQTADRYLGVANVQVGK